MKLQTYYCGFYCRQPIPVEVVGTEIRGGEVMSTVREKGVCGAEPFHAWPHELSQRHPDDVAAERARELSIRRAGCWDGECC